MSVLPQNAAQLIYSIEDVQRLTSLRKTSIYKFVSKGALKIIKIGRRTGVRAEDLNAFIDSLSSAGQSAQSDK